MSSDKIIVETRKKLKELLLLRSEGKETLREIDEDGKETDFSVDLLIKKYQIMLEKAESEWEYEE